MKKAFALGIVVLLCAVVVLSGCTQQSPRQASDSNAGVVEWGDVNAPAGSEAGIPIPPIPSDNNASIMPI